MKPSYEELEQMLEESQREFRSADIKMQNLEAKCEKLAAENAGLKAVIEAVQEVANQSQGIAGWHLNGAVAEWDEVLPEINNVETPATDAFMRERGE
ncbi:TPA: hypothetical protein ND504_004174 [Citrobacter farmeri]|nr:hypothetical protein [Citrobacter farmeri]HCD7631287.1 hypothetical protein [Citrobacter farmeri]